MYAMHIYRLTSPTISWPGLNGTLATTLATTNKQLLHWIQLLIKITEIFQMSIIPIIRYAIIIIVISCVATRYSNRAVNITIVTVTKYSLIKQSLNCTR